MEKIGKRSMNCDNTLHLDLVELILSRLPLIDVVRAGCVCKSWNDIIRSSTFLSSYVPQEAWLYVDARRLIASPSTRKFSVAEEAWLFVNAERFVVSPLAEGFKITKDYGRRFPDCCGVAEVSKRSVVGAGGIVYSLAGAKRSKLSYKLHLLDPDWKVTPSMRYGRDNPIVGLLRSPDSLSYKIIVAGGALTERAEQAAAVEIYSSETDSWEESASLPINEFSFTLRSPALYTTTATLRDRLYVCHLGRVSVFNVRLKSWSTLDVSVEGSISRSICNVRSSHLLSCAGRLLLIALQNSADNEIQFRVWSLNELSMMGVECTHLCEGLKPTPILKNWFSAASTYRTHRQISQSIGALAYSPTIYCRGISLLKLTSVRF